MKIRNINILLMTFILIFLNILKVNAASDVTSDLTDDKKFRIGFRIMSDFYSNPYLYLYQTQSNAFTLNGSIEGGLKVNNFTFGFEFFEHYFSLNSDLTDGRFIGAFNNMRGLFTIHYNINNYIEIKFGLGGAFLSTFYKYSDLGGIGNKEGGLSITTDGLFRFPWKYFQLRVLNKFDMFITTTSIDPYFSTELRAEFHPYFDWINLYCGIGVMPWTYKSIDVNVEALFFLWSVGVSIDIDSTKMSRKPAKTFNDDNKSNITQIQKSDPVIIEEKIVNNDIIKQDVDKINDLKDAKKGDVISFSDITFYANSYSINPESYEILDKIAAVLLERKELIIEIGGYTNATSNQQSELVLSLKRAEQVVNYFIYKKVDPTRMTAKGYGGVGLKKNEINEVNRRVEIKILNIKFK